MCSTVTVYFEQLLTPTYGIHTRQADRELMSGSMKEVMGKVLVCADSTYYILMKTFFSPCTSSPATFSIFNMHLLITY
jgi:hypothetical protein